MKKLLLQHPVISFSVLTLLWSSAVWLVILPYFKLSGDWFWLGECAPGLMALFLSFLAGRSRAVIDLIKPVTYWRVNPFYYYLVFVLIAFFYLAAIGANALDGQSIIPLSIIYPKTYFEFMSVKFYGLWMIPILVVLYCFCEELGWRGYALPKLMKRYDAFTASVIVAIVWVLFHIPLMKLSVLIAHPFSFVLYFIYTLMGSLFLSWLYLNTGRSLLLVSIVHAVSDTYGALSPSIISSLGQGESALVIGLRFLAFLPFFVLLYRQRKQYQCV